MGPVDESGLDGRKYGDAYCARFNAGAGGSSISLCWLCDGLGGAVLLADWVPIAKPARLPRAEAKELVRIKLGKDDRVGG